MLPRSSARLASSCSSAPRRREADAGRASATTSAASKRSARSTSAAEETRGLAGEVTGDLRIGLMPTFTRAVLAPVLEDFVPRCPEVRLHIVEGYSGLLTDMVLDDELDFAVVPAFEGTIGLKSRLLVRDREMLISGPQARLHSARAGAARGLPAAEDRPAGARQYSAAQSRYLFPDARRRNRRNARNGCDDCHARIHRALRLGRRFCRA